jgi:hypothetical protein
MSLKRILPKLPEVLVINNDALIFTKYIESISITGHYWPPRPHSYIIRMIGVDCCFHRADKSLAKDYPIIDEYFRIITEKE